MDSKHFICVHRHLTSLLFSSLLFVLTLVVFVFVFVPVVNAASFIVDDPGDDDDANPGDGVCLTSGMVCTLRAAIEEANARKGADTIGFSLSYPATILLGSVLPIISEDLTMNGPGASSLTIDGQNFFRVFYVDKGVTFNLQGVTITNGFAKSDFGGGIYNLGILNVATTVFTVNSADAGGGIYSSGTLAVTQSTFTNNQASGGEGGGIYNEGSSSINNSTFSLSSADKGGGISNRGTLSMTNSTLAGNSANLGGGFSNGGTATAKNTIIANSSSGGNCGGSVFAGGSTNNLSDDATCVGGFTQTSSILLGTLGNYGGSTQTIPLLPNSAAIDAGDDAACPAQDQRGVSRVGTCDIGAFKSRGFTLGSQTGTPQSTPINTAFPQPLHLHVTNGSGEPVNGGLVIFTAPVSGASITTPTITATISSGAVSQTVTANGIVGGSYYVTASARGVATSVNYVLTNVCPTMVVTVINNADGGAGSLRQAINDVCVGGTINFAGNYTITLTSQLTIAKNLTIDGTGRNVVISGNNSTRVFYVSSSVNATFTGLTIINGNSSDYGGGIHIAYNGALMVTNTTLSGNRCTYSGGGIWNAGVLMVTNSTFSGNSAGIEGGGIDNRETLTVTNSTFSGNSAMTNYGGGISNPYDTVWMVKNTILANSTSGGNCMGNVFGAGSTNNLSDDATCSGGVTHTSSILLGALGDYGGSTPTIPRLPNSAAIDAGNSVSCPTQDQRGVSRVGTCDIGAFESRGFAFCNQTGTPQSTPINTAFPQPLHVYVTSAFGEPVNGGQVILTAPVSGASIAGTTPITVSISSGTVSRSVTANGIAGGPYNVTANGRGIPTPVYFVLTNLSRLFLPLILR